MFFMFFLLNVLPEMGKIEILIVTKGDAMPIVSWSDSYSVNVTGIDAQHKQARLTR